MLYSARTWCFARVAGADRARGQLRIGPRGEPVVGQNLPVARTGDSAGHDGEQQDQDGAVAEAGHRRAAAVSAWLVSSISRVRKRCSPPCDPQRLAGAGVFGAEQRFADQAVGDVAGMRQPVFKGLDPEADLVTHTDFVRPVTLQLNDMFRKGKIGRGRAMRWQLQS